VLPALHERGHDAVAPELPLDDPAAGFEERARPAIDALSGADDPVVVGHSMGSAYGTLTAAAVPGALLVHLCPRLGGYPEPAGAPSRFREGIPFPADRSDGTSAWDADVAMTALYGRLPPETARDLADSLCPMAQPPDSFPLSGPPPNPAVLIYAAEDEIFEPAWERFMARELLGIEPIELPGGHFPMAEDPEGLAELLDSVQADRGS
jgi:pimeloyl-ACP methyl ester carboxylesterase